MYVVTRTYSFDSDSVGSLFTDRETASSFLRSAWEDFYNRELAEGGDLIEHECYFEEDYARITWTDRDRVEFHLIPVVYADLVMTSAPGFNKSRRNS
jgi:hypothetical protein